jgi:hypothetical protein
MGLRGILFGTIASAVGAVLYWAMAYQGHGNRTPAVGAILLVVGAFVLIVSVLDVGQSRRSARSERRTIDGRVAQVHGPTGLDRDDVK